ncbi:DUF4331 family protein [Aurantiacibacter gilvus]|uniref:DUF4331 family protein n=1 Tax=Aurantiacibacter gilvus TaxID=3139141 RepID=A0ABU9IGU8_9SPHN
MTFLPRKNLRLLAAASAILATAMLTSCFDDDDDVVAAPTPGPAPAPTPTPTPTTASFDVTPCLTQEIPGTGGFTVADAVVPDTLTINLGAGAGFPNGRLLTDPVVDATLGVIFLDLMTHSPATLAMIPLNPPANDVAFQSDFPFLAPPQGTPPIASSGSSNFNFRSDAPGAYVRVDRVGMPAVATVLIGSDLKNAYNDARPQDDITGEFVPEITAQLTGLTEALADDLTGAGLSPCATPN